MTSRVDAWRKMTAKRQKLGIPRYIGQRGRKTGLLLPTEPWKDEDGLDNIEAFFENEDKDRFFDPNRVAEQQHSVDITDLPDMSLLETTPGAFATPSPGGKISSRRQTPRRSAMKGARSPSFSQTPRRVSFAASGGYDVGDDDVVDASVEDEEEGYSAIDMSEIEPPDYTEASSMDSPRTPRISSRNATPTIRGRRRSHLASPPKYGSSPASIASSRRNSGASPHSVVYEPDSIHGTPSSSRKSLGGGASMVYSGGESLMMPEFEDLRTSDMSLSSSVNTSMAPSYFDDDDDAIGGGGGGGGYDDGYPAAAAADDDDDDSGGERSETTDDDSMEDYQLTPRPSKKTPKRSKGKRSKGGKRKREMRPVLTEMQAENMSKKATPGRRRSKRTRHKPLQYWMGERVMYSKPGRDSADLPGIQKILTVIEKE